MSLTTDPDDPRLTHGIDEAPTRQADAYLVLSDEERAKGFVRPVRSSYQHVGIRPNGPTRDLTDEEQELHSGRGYVLFEEYPDDDNVTGRYWTQRQLESGCGAVTTMALPLAETYARDPGFYGGTFCVNCAMHLPVEEFVWEGTDERVGT